MTRSTDLEPSYSKNCAHQDLQKHATNKWLVCNPRPQRIDGKRNAGIIVFKPLCELFDIVSIRGVRNVASPAVPLDIGQKPLSEKRNSRFASRLHRSLVLGVAGDLFGNELSSALDGKQLTRFRSAQIEMWIT
jgi:hypothetical protein